MIFYKKDILGSLWFHLWWIKVKFLFLVNKLKIYRCFKIKGVVIGHNTKILGTPYIYRYPMSQIIIGNNCTFLSNSVFNFRGINHQCILQTSCPSAKILIGDKCGFSGVSIVADKLVSIGNNVIVGTNVVIGDRDDHSDIYQSKPKSVSIRDNVWIGMNSVVLKGVEIGENSIIGANSVVTKNIPANVIAAGNPCKVIKQRL